MLFYKNNDSWSRLHTGQMMQKQLNSGPFYVDEVTPMLVSGPISIASPQLHFTKLVRSSCIFHNGSVVAESLGAASSSQWPREMYKRWKIVL
jgi:hypothetical protein